MIGRMKGNRKDRFPLRTLEIRKLEQLYEGNFLENCHSILAISSTCEPPFQENGVKVKKGANSLEYMNAEPILTT